MSALDAIQDFIRAMEVSGMAPVEPIANRLGSGELIRFRCVGDSPGRLNGWAILYLDERPAGAFGNYRLQLSSKWKSGETTTLSESERSALRREWAEAKQKRADERARSETQAATEAMEMWSSAGTASDRHPYAAKKRLNVGPLRQSGDKLLVPMYDSSGFLWNLQRIAPDGAKRFLRGGRTDGLFTIIGEFAERGQKACIGEGYATMDAVNRSTGYPCIVCFSAKNMAAVGRKWFASRPDLDLIVCADDDHGNPNGNVGKAAAEALAAEIGAKIAFPAASDAEAA